MGTETNKALAERVDAILNTGAGHWFDGLIEFLTWESSQKPAPGRGRNRPSARPDCRPGRHEGRADGGRLAVPHPGGPKREARRPNGAPAYYLGRPAHIYITAMRPHRHAASDHPEQAVTGGGERPPSQHGHSLGGPGAGTARMTPATTSLPVLQAR